jgi:hypothetical protein
MGFACGALLLLVALALVQRLRQFLAASLEAAQFFRQPPHVAGRAVGLVIAFVLGLQFG